MSKRPDRRAPANVDTKRRIVAYLIADDPEIRQWLAEQGLIADDEETIWILTPAGEAAMARLHQQCVRDASAPPLH